MEALVAVRTLYRVQVWLLIIAVVTVGLALTLNLIRRT